MESIFKTEIKKVKVEANCTHESITADYNNYKSATDEEKVYYDFSGFIGGWEVEDGDIPASICDTYDVYETKEVEVPAAEEGGEPTTKLETVFDKDGNPIVAGQGTYQWSEKFVHRFSLDGKKMFLFAGAPNNGKSGYASSEYFIKLADELGIENVFTKSDMKDLLSSEAYSNNEDI